MPDQWCAKRQTSTGTLLKLRKTTPLIPKNKAEFECKEYASISLCFLMLLKKCSERGK